MNKQLLTIFKALSDETRLAIVKLILEKREICNQTAGQYFKLSQPTLSHHFNELVDAGILSMRKDGIWRFYTLRNDYLKENGLDLRKILSKS